MISMLSKGKNMVDAIHRMLITSSILEPSLRAFAGRLDQIDSDWLLYAMRQAGLGSSEVCKERNRIPLRAGGDLVLYKIIHPVACEIATIEYPKLGRVGQFDYWPHVMDFTLPVRWNSVARLPYSTRADLPIYTAERQRVRAELEFVHT